VGGGAGRRQCENRRLLLQWRRGDPRERFFDGTGIAFPKMRLDPFHGGKRLQDNRICLKKRGIQFREAVI